MSRSFIKVATVLLPIAIVGWGASLGAASNAVAAEDVVTVTVAGKFAKVVTRLKRQITAQKLVIIKQIPFQKMLKMVGLKTEKMVGFEIFHPRFGKVIYETDPAAFKDVPLRIIVKQVGDEVSLEYRKPSVVFAPYPGLAKLGEQLDGVFAEIVRRVAK